MTRKGLLKKGLRGLALHVALAAGSLLFAAPFLWLMTTSAKAPDELYPPRWKPPIPDHVVESPYMALRANEEAVRPIGVGEEAWNERSAPIRQGISAKAVSLQGVLPDYIGPYLASPVLSEALFARILRRAPDEVLGYQTEACVAWFAANTTEEEVRQAFDLAYRRAALSEVAFIGWDMSSEKPFDDQPAEWKVIEGDATLVRRSAAMGRASYEVHYSFARTERFVLQSVMPLRMEPGNFKKIRVANRADRSWHAFRITVELAGKAYRAEQAAFLRTERWQDAVWQVPSEEDGGVMVRSWLRMREPEPSTFNEPGQVRVTVTFERQSRLVTIANKYLYNYTEVLRKAPVWTYVWNSVILVTLNILGQILGSSLVAFAFARLRWPGREFFFVLLLATLMIPPQVTLIPVFLIWKQLGFYNTLKPLYLPAFFGSAFFIFLMRQFMRTIPGDLEDSAKIDGCGYFGIYARIIMPLVKPALATIAIFTFMNVWNDFMGPLIFVADQELYPLSLGLFALHAMLMQFAQHEIMMAAAVLMTLPVVVLFFLAQRQFIQGVTLTGLKG